MKNRFKLLFAAVALIAFTTACQKETTGKSNPEEGEKTSVSLTIITDQATPTRGAGDETEIKTEGEANIATEKGVKIYVFKESGMLDFSGERKLVSNGPGGLYTLSEPFEITAGNRYFYVFLNDDRAVTTPENMESFMRTAIPTPYDRNVPAIADPTTFFLMGTLWPEITDVAAGGTTDAPVRIELGIGNLASKVQLTNIDYVTKNSTLKGKFTEGRYRLGGLPLNIHNVGVSKGYEKPTGQGVLVTSYVHNKEYSVEDYLLTMDNDAWKVVANPFYATENTTAPNNKSLQYFGNTSFVQIETVYIPDNSEVYDGTTGELSSRTADYQGTFWTGEVDKVRRIYDADPTTTIKGIENVKEYKDGKNYHKFAIFDKNETDDVIRNRVLRNHYYEFTVNAFNDLGAKDKEVLPNEIVPTKTTVEVNVKILDWSKVTGTVDL